MYNVSYLNFSYALSLSLSGLVIVLLKKFLLQTTIWFSGFSQSYYVIFLLVFMDLLPKIRNRSCLVVSMFLFLCDCVYSLNEKRNNRLLVHVFLFYIIIIFGVSGRIMKRPLHNFIQKIKRER